MQDLSMSPFVLLGRNAVRYATDVFLVVSFVYISSEIVAEYQLGGQAFKQGDWLINNHGEYVRRGIFGSGILAASDSLGIGPLLLVCGLQIALFAVLYGCFRLIVHQADGPLFWILLILSPAMFAVFWVADSGGSARKELLAFTGLALSTLGALRQKMVLFWIGVAVFCLGFIGHEAMILFIPTFLAILFVSGLKARAKTQALAAAVLVLCAAAFSLGYTVKFFSVENTASVCAPLQQRGLEESICTGAIIWLGADSAIAEQVVRDQLTTPNVLGFVGTYIAALLPLMFLVWVRKGKIVHFLGLVLLGMPFLPLYFIAIDWGRWMSFHVFSASLILACVMAHYRGGSPKRGLERIAVLLAGLSLLISPLHTIGAAEWGALGRLVSVVVNALT